MKHALFLIVSISPLLNCMEAEKNYIVSEWDAKAYDNGCTFQTKGFIHLLKRNNIPLTNKKVLDMGCGTGRIAEKLSKEALSIHCVDASQNMITHAKNNISAKNISFEQSFAETFKPQQSYNLAIMSFCFDWFHNQEEALEKIYQSLEDNGELFATIHTSDTPEPTSLPAARDTIQSFDTTYKTFTGKSFIELSGSSFPSDKELVSMLEKIGFTIIKKEQQSIESILTEQEIRDNKWPIVASKPITQVINYFFNQYIKNYLSRTQKTNDGKYQEKVITTIIHAHKTRKMNSL